MSQQQIRPIHIKGVALPFVLAFAGYLLLLSTKYNVWYPQPDMAKFQWYGTAYLMAYAIAEMARRGCWQNYLLLLGVFAMFLGDIARHFTFDLGYIWFHPGGCAAAGDPPPCSILMPFVLHYHHAVLAMSALFAIKLTADLAHRLRRRAETAN
jgi:hypothetical protein